MGNPLSHFWSTKKSGEFARLFVNQEGIEPSALPLSTAILALCLEW